MRCKHCLCLDCCNMNEPQRILVKQNFPKLRPLLAIERSNGNHHWFCEKACDMAIGHRHYAHSPFKKSRGGGFHTGNRPHRLFGVSSKNGHITQISEPGSPGSDTLLCVGWPFSLVSQRTLQRVCKGLDSFTLIIAQGGNEYKPIISNRLAVFNLFSRSITLAARF